jgi:transketolase
MALASATVRRMADAIRVLAMDAVEQAKSGHPGMPMGMADVATILFTEVMRHDPANPAWPNRDRFVLSAGHGSMLLYASLHLAGYARPMMDEIRAFRQWGSPCAGHPEYGDMPGIETTTGPLGQGLAMAVGLAIAERHLNAHHPALIDHWTYVIAGDGCLMEGISHEAIGLAGHLGLGRLVVVWDDNAISIDGATSMATSEDIPARFRAAGWQVVAADAHDPDSIRAAFAAAKTDESKPTLIAAKSVIGYGAPTKQGTKDTHGSPLGAAEVAATRTALGWDAPAFALPADVASAWAQAMASKRGSSAGWEAVLAAAPDRAVFQQRWSGDVADRLTPAIQAHIAGLLAKPQAMATRKASELALEAINAAMGETIGGSADLTGSNNTKTKGLAVLDKANYGGRYLHYGVREFGMAAAMNGMALHGGVIPYGGTFLVFADYCRPAIRLSAIQHQRVVYVMTHDSIGLGEDGPTHQPIEHLASLRAMPNCRVFRPCDTIETAECWQLALEHSSGPSVLALTRQNLPQLRDSATTNLSAQGAYVLRAARGATVSLIATGSEVAIAVEAQALLEQKGVVAEVVSMPCWELFAAQPRSVQNAVLPPDRLAVAIEAGASFGWERWVGRDGVIVGIDRFGASAPYETLYKEFGLTANSVAEAVLAAL